ncbi:uncharacterized protein LOC114244280 [Bombyx mandarina]|uniref:Uncharacterized protein LOC114244280 n=1 Tax=Bombyx mandarina TaxID=7092 RepID=A0A6J2JQI3_BOMMA|nr:uncharacterized protein LOC114244280 [Bombyx mandarina]
MDCCNYSEYRAHGQYGAGAGWEGYVGYAPVPYAPYAHGYYAPHAHDPYARYYRYDYPGHHMHHAEHVMPMDYGVYASKEARVRRALARREQRAVAHTTHMPLTSAPSSECGMNNRGSAYCEPHMWTPYQTGFSAGGWNGASAVNGGLWPSRGSCSRDVMRYTPDCRPVKGPHMNVQNYLSQDGRSATPYHMYGDSSFNGESGARHGNSTDYTVSETRAEMVRSERERLHTETRRSPPEEKRPPLVPLPAFQQAFGSTEIGKFAEAFSRAEIALDDVPGDNFSYDSFQEWDGPLEPHWSSQPTSREIKCEENY